MSSYKVSNPIDYILVGGGGHCHSCINSILKSGHNIIGIVDNYIEGNILGFPIVGCDDDTSQLMLVHSNAEFLVTVGMVKGTSSLRKRLYENLVTHNAIKVATVSSCAAVSPFSSIGAGSIVLEGATINANASIGNNVIVNTRAIIEHDSYIGNHSHISTGAIVNGGVQVGENCMIGSGSIILQGIKIVANTTIAAGSVVTKDITIAGTWIGTPAKIKGEQNVE